LTFGEYRSKLYGGKTGLEEAATRIGACKSDVGHKPSVKSPGMRGIYKAVKRGE